MLNLPFERGHFEIIPAQRRSAGIVKIDEHVHAGEKAALVTANFVAAAPGRAAALARTVDDLDASERRPHPTVIVGAVLGLLAVVGRFVDDDALLIVLDVRERLRKALERGRGLIVGQRRGGEKRGRRVQQGETCRGACG